MSSPGTLHCLLAFLVAYVVGATPFGYVAGRLRGVDVRTMGSGNIGATNVIRVLGKKTGIPVFILDVLKGLLPVLLVSRWCEARNIAPDLPAVLAAIGTVLGHNFTFWLQFKGGKGIATSAGAMLALVPLALGTAVLVWLVLFFTTRYVAVASIGSAVTIAVAPLVQRALTGQPGNAVLVLSVFIGALAVWRHRSNIQRLLKGTENRFTRRPKNTAS